MRRLLDAKLAWVIAGLVLLVGLYALLGFYATPRLIRTQAIDYVRETYGRQLTLGEVRIHPFKLQADVRDLSLPDVDGTPMLAFGRLFVDFELSSLWQRAFVFREVRLEAPSVRAVIRRDGSLNLAELAPPPDDEPDEGPLPGVWIQSFALSDGTIDLLNNLRRHPVERHFSPVRFLLQDFRTTAEGGGFNLTARSQQDEVFAWTGRFALEPTIASTGEFTFTDLRVPGIAEFIGDDLPMLLPRGDIDLGGTYALEVGETVDLEVALPRIAVNDLALRARGVEDDWVEIPSIVVSDTRLAVPELTVAVGAIVVEGLTAHLWMEPDGTLNVDRLFAAPTAAPVDATPVPASRRRPPTPATRAPPVASSRA